MRTRLAGLGAGLALLLVAVVPAQAQNITYPGAGIFSFSCVPGGLTISANGAFVISAALQQIGPPLVLAIATEQNQFITGSTGVSLYALKSNELQVHYDYNPDATKLVVPSTICGAPVVSQVATPIPPVYQPPIYQPPVYQPPIYQPPVYQPPVYQPPVYGTSCANPGGRQTYIVRYGDTLASISRRFGVSLQAIQSLNGIGNPNLIYAGTCLLIP